MVDNFIPDYLFPDFLPNLGFVVVLFLDLLKKELRRIVLFDLHFIVSVFNKLNELFNNFSWLLIKP